MNRQNVHEKYTIETIAQTQFKTFPNVLKDGRSVHGNRVAASGVREGDNLMPRVLRRDDHHDRYNPMLAVPSWKPHLGKVAVTLAGLSMHHCVISQRTC